MLKGQFIKDFLGIKSKSKKDGHGFNLKINSITDLIEAEDGKFKIVFKVTPVNGELISEGDLYFVSEAIAGALNSFDGRIGIYIQSECIDIETNLANMEKRKAELKSETKVMLLEKQKKHIQSMAGRSRNVLNFYTVLEVVENNYRSAEELLSDSYASYKSELESAGIYAERLYEHDIKELLYRRMNPKASEIEIYKRDWDYEDLLPENAKIFKDGKHIEIGSRLYRFFSINKYPKAVESYRWLRKVFNLKGDISVAIILTPKNKNTILKELSRAVNELGAKSLASSKDEAKRQKYQSEANSARDMIAELGSDNVNLYDTNITIGISATTKEKLNTLANLLRSKISSTYCQSCEIKYKGFMPYIVTLPILSDNKITKDYVWNLTTSDIASLIVYDSSELMEPSGILIGENVISNGLIILDTYGKIYNNPHECIIADSGSGKSFRIKVDAIRHVPYRDYIIMFDLEGELYFPWAQRYKFSPAGGIVLNPFHIRNAIIDRDDEVSTSDIGAYLATKIMDCIIFFKWIISGMSPFEEALLEEDIRDVYKASGITFKSTELPEKYPTLATLSKIMSEKIRSTKTSGKSQEARQNMLASLNPYIKGAYSAMFNGQTNWDYSFHTVLDISALPEAVKKPTYDILLKDTWQFCKYDKDKTKRLYVDEAHQFADPDNPQTLKFLSTCIKRGRKYGISFVTATQNLPDFLSIQRYGQAILDNSYFKIFFRLGETDIPVVKKLYNFSEPELKILRGSSSLKKGARGKGILIAGSQRVVVQIIASKDELYIVDPDQYREIFKT